MHTTKPPLRSPPNALRSNRWGTRAPTSLLSALLVIIIFLGTILPVLAIDYDSLTWARWEQEYRAAANAQTLPQLYTKGPRVRAKVFVAEAITLSQLRDGEAIFRQRISEIAGVETIDRVQLEFIQTDATHENATGAYAVSLGISALPFLSANSTAIDVPVSATKVFIAAVDRERVRIMDSLRYGGIVNSRNVTIGSLRLFGSPMLLLDLALDGETFYQVSLKPWVGVHFALTSVSASSALSEPFADPFQNLQLRFMLASLLHAACVDTSDIIVRRLDGADVENSGDAIVTVPFIAYYADVVLMQIEIHVENSEYSRVILGRLLNTTSGSEAGVMFSSPLTDRVYELDRRLTLLAIDVDTAADQTTWDSTLTSSASGSTSTSVDSDACEIGLRFRDIPVSELERYKWWILRGVWLLMEPLLGSRVRVSFRSLALLMTATIDSKISLTNDWTKPARSLSGSASVPVNVKDYELRLLVETTDDRDLDVASLREFLAVNIASSASTTALRDQLLGDSSIGVESLSEAAAIDLGDVADVSVVTAPAFHTSSAFVGINLTLVAASDFEDSITSLGTTIVDVFQLHAIRSALVLLVQQVGIVDSDLSLAFARSIALPVLVDAGTTSSRWVRATTLEFHAIIQDESQRRGVRRMALSRRLATTIAAYTREKLAVVAQSVTMHADKSLRRPRYLPGSLLPFPTESSSTGFVERSGVLSSTHATPTSFYIYRFQMPSTADPASGIQPSASHQCPAPSTTPNVVKVCLKLRIRSDLSSRTLFLREISSVQRISSSSVLLPPPIAISASNWTDVAAATASIEELGARGNATSDFDAPWIALADEVTTWMLATELEVSSTHLPDDGVWSLRLAFSAIANGTDTTATEAFSLLVALNGTDGNLKIRKVDAVEVAARDWEDPTAASSLADASSSQVLATASHPNVTILLSNFTGTTNGVAGELYTASVKAEVDLRVDASLGWGMYALPPYSTADQQLDATCSACMTDPIGIDSCADSPGACGAISGCFRSLIDMDPTIISRLLGSTEPQATADATWALEQCLSPLDGSVWPHSLLPALNGTFRCLWTNECPVSTQTASTSYVALHHEPGEQVVRFQPNSEGGRNLMLRFVLDIDGGELNGGSTATLEYVGSFSTSASAAPTVLSDQLTSIYRRFSSTALVEAKVQADATSGVQQIELVLRYYFLGSLMLPYMSVTDSSSSGSAITASVSRASESLVLRVIA